MAAKYPEHPTEADQQVPPPRVAAAAAPQAAALAGNAVGLRAAGKAPGEIGGASEEEAAAFVAEHMPGKPVVAFIGGRSAPKGKRLGHAGAIISGNTGTPESKVAAFAAAGVPVADRPSDIPKLLAERLKAVPA